MSHNRSGLLAGLITGLLAALICAAALGVAILFQLRMPAAITTFGNGFPLLLAVSLAMAALVSFAISVVRPRSFVLIPVAAIYAGGAVMAGQILGISIMKGVGLRTPPGEESPADLTVVTLDNFLTGLPYAPSLYQDVLAKTWTTWLCIAVATLAALILVTLRVLRVRRRQRAAAEAAQAEEKQAKEPEYRAPFEPAQAPTPKPTTDLFTPRNPTGD
ncbi:hypothetical protein ACFOY2_23785 [Nonomuraea purpurea]|uniref:Uncharacterized protein n=1 Tax=Nonomuraea purpurea TaxID=1849276 RepID=A0ABV8GBN5_9ACTN